MNKNILDQYPQIFINAMFFQFSSFKLLII